MSLRSRLVARERELGRPVRVGLVGAGQMGQGFASQLKRTPGVALAAVADVDINRARAALDGATGDPVATTDAAELVDVPIDVVVEATGVPDVGARVILQSLLAGRDVATLNVECDVTIGRLLQLAATQTGSHYTVCRGDEPVEAKILVDYARDLGFEVVAAGKGKNNPFHPDITAADLAKEARERGMNPAMLCSFVDGSKAMVEMAALANTTGLELSTRGMHGPPSTVPTLHQTFALEADGGILDRPGVVDYCTGPVAPGVFVVIRTDDPYVNEELQYLKLGDGPYFTLYRPYHLASIEAPLSVFELALDGRPSMVAEHWMAEVAARAKRPLRRGELVEGIGGSMVSGVADKQPDFVRDGLVPIGVIAGARLTRDVPAGELLTTDAVELDDASLIVRLRRLHDALLTGDEVGLPDIEAAIGVE